MLHQNPSLLRQACYINGQWMTEKKGISVFNPATGQLLGQVPSLSEATIQQAIHVAAQALPAWRSATALERAQRLVRWHTLILENLADLAQLLCLEQGKPLKEAEEEIRYGASFVLWFAEEAKRVMGEIIPAPWPQQTLWVQKQAVGVIGAITPWNFPTAMITRKCAPALAAGCTVVLKPSELTPFSALALAALAEEAGFPPGIFNVITGDAELISTIFCKHPAVRKLSFTGSTHVGRLLIQKSAPQIKRLSLELGGNAPFIVFDDAQLNQAVEGALAAKFRNSGQTCICVNRFYLHEKIYDRFVERFVPAVRTLKIGPGIDPTTDLGPLIQHAAVVKVQTHITDALQKGARLLCGGKVHPLGSPFFEATVLDQCTAAMQLAQEETFGPVAALFRFSTQEEVLKLVNATESGLAAYFYTQNLETMLSTLEHLEYGLVGVNTPRLSSTVIPFGGIKQSGFGHEGSHYGIEEFLNLKSVCLQTSNLS